MASLLRFVACVIATFAVCVLLVMFMLSLIDLHLPVSVKREVTVPVEFVSARVPDEAVRLSYQPAKPSAPLLPPPAPVFANGIGGFHHVRTKGCEFGHDPAPMPALAEIRLSAGPHHRRFAQPAYPGRAWDKDLAGWVLLRFNIDATGEVFAPAVVDHCAWQHEGRLCRNHPNNVFDASALAALARFRYMPAIIDGVRAPTASMYYRMVFELEDPER